MSHLHSTSGIGGAFPTTGHAGIAEHTTREEAVDELLRAASAPVPMSRGHLGQVPIHWKTALLVFPLAGAVTASAELLLDPGDTFWGRDPADGIAVAVLTRADGTRVIESSTRRPRLERTD